MLGKRGCNVGHLANIQNCFSKCKHKDFTWLTKHFENKSYFLYVFHNQVQINEICNVLTVSTNQVVKFCNPLNKASMERMQTSNVGGRVL